MKIVITSHAKDRRKKGPIPTDKLRMLVQYLIDSHEFHTKDNGLYKFRKGGSCAIISKKNDTAVLVTFFGKTGWLIDVESTDNIGNFICQYQGTDKNDRAYRKKIMKENSPTHIRRSKITKFIETIPHLDKLGKSQKEKIKRGTFEVVELDLEKRLKLKSLVGQSPGFVLQCKSDSYQFVEILNIDGKFIKTLSKKYYLSNV